MSYCRVPKRAAFTADETDDWAIVAETPDDIG
jgi:hypothetical protein